MHKIKHLVFSGGGPNFLFEYGALKKSHHDQIWSYENLDSIYGTSSGAILGLIVLLQLNWDHVDEYLIKRPWEKVFHISPSLLFQFYENKGLFGSHLFSQILQPLLKSADLDCEITLTELFTRFPIPFHVYSTSLNSFQTVCVNYLTYPNITIINAIQMSCSIPPLFAPIQINDEWFFDGGLLSNYPLKFCESDKETIMGITHMPVEEKNISISNILDYIFTIINKIIHAFNHNSSLLPGTEIKIKMKSMNLQFWKEAICSSETRKKMIEEVEYSLHQNLV